MTPADRQLLADLRDALKDHHVPVGCDTCRELIDRASARLAETEPPAPIVYEPPKPRVRSPQETGALGGQRSKTLRALRSAKADAGRIGGIASAAQRARKAGRA